VKDIFPVDKVKELNVSQEELKTSSDLWKNQELNFMIRALRPRSFREGKIAFDICLEKSRKLLVVPQFLLHRFSFKVPKTSQNCKYVPALMDCFIKSSPFNEKFWKKESMLYIN